MNKPLRLWPGVVAVILLLLIRYAMPIVWPEGLIYSVFGGLIGGLAIIVWWAFFSRAAMIERWGALVLMIAALLGTKRIVHPSISTGMMGMMLPVYAIPVLGAAFVAWAVFTRNLADGVRRVTLVATVLLACGVFTLLQTEGMTAEARSDLKWRWSPTAEDRLLASATEQPIVAIPAAPPAAAPVTKPAAPSEPAAVREQPAPKVASVNTGAGWPGFRGPNRNDSVSGVRIVTDWAAKPPVELWRRPIGPGWSSFAVQGDLVYTQEQRGAEEVVDCYNAATGKLVWRHGDAVRFWESNAGAGPRATPTLNNERVYTFGATGIVNSLDARSGTVVWSRNAATDTGVKVPEWGFASSPLVVGDIVVVAAAGKLAAYDTGTGEPRWYGPDGRYGYSSPHSLTIGGVPQILLTSGPGVTSVAPADGKQLWEHTLPAGTRIVQPAVTADGDLLVGEGEGHNLHRLSVSSSGAGAWTVEERWSSMGLKPYFSDLVVHKGHAYGFDGSILACIDVTDGKRKWKGGRYGSGQLVLIPEQDLLLVLSEEGELALVAAVPDQFKELGRFPAIQGKTWNHPVVSGDLLLVRNGQEMAAFRLTLEGR